MDSPIDILSTPQFLRAIKPLRLIFWGAILYVLQFGAFHDRIPFDIFMGTIGLAMILAGINGLRKIIVNDDYLTRLAFIAAIIVVMLIASVTDLFGGWDSIKYFGLLLMFFAILVFSSSMIDLCMVSAAVYPGRSWLRTRSILLVMLVMQLPLYIMLPIIYFGHFDAIWPGNDGIDFLAYNWISIVILGSISIIHFLVSTWRTIRHAKLRRKMSHLTPEERICFNCNYSLRGIMSDQCPECGTRNDYDAARAFD